MHWPATRNRRRLRPPGTAWYQAPDTPDMTVRTRVAAGARPLHLVPWLAAVLWLGGCMGFEPPLNSLRFWLQGVPDPASPSTETADAQGYLGALAQSDWTVTF